ncbi:hypothetical protein G7Y79_00049g085080 [Physcia stellaris]|nr:hypothetical protein G7Y79_00049g085080 [Physcia stellaris]
MSVSPAPNKSDRSPALLGGSIVLVSVASTAVTFRLVSRRLKRLSWGADDYLVVIALTFAYAMLIAMLFCIQDGLGKHLHGADLLYLGDASKALYVFEDIFPTCTAATKLSILCLYRRIFSTRDRAFAWALYIVAGLQIAWAIAGFFTTVFQCSPVSGLWRVVEGTIAPTKLRCIKIVPALLGLASVNTLLNAAVLILPMPMVWKLQMPLKQKGAVCGILVLGCADVVASIVRCVLTSRGVGEPAEQLWTAAPAVMLSFTEPCVGILCACLPVMRPLLVAMGGPIKRFFQSKSSDSPSFTEIKASHSKDSSGPTEYPNRQTEASDVRAGISARMPVGEGPLFTNRVYRGTSSQWPLAKEDTAGAIRVRSELEQTTARG